MKRAAQFLSTPSKNVTEKYYAPLVEAVDQHPGAVLRVRLS